MEENQYTPSKIVGTEMQFSIPLYQRLFEWEDTQINQLMNDLYSYFEKETHKPYYIGMLTVYKNNDKWDLVDGQQRFTVIILMAIVFGWKDVLELEPDKFRLIFTARLKDSEYIKDRFTDQDAKYVNKKMEKGLQTIKKFLADKKIDKDKFSEYVKNNLTFFITSLPESYQSYDLNKYFETMNATGRGLENYEILKVNLLRKLSEKKEKYTRIWNAVSEMDRQLIRKRNEEDSDKFIERQNKALNDICNLEDYCNFNGGKETDNISNPEFKSIKEITPNKEAPKENYHSNGDRSILSFSEFLLHVLWLQMNETDRKFSSDFFNVHKLLETFKKYLRDENVEEFFNNLLKYRALFDYFIIRVANNESLTAYTLSFKESEKENESTERESLMQYQSMLYVSTSSYLWLIDALTFINEKLINKESVTAGLLLNEIIKIDNERHKEEDVNLSYNSINRYWFWRLDYYLWVKRKELFKDDDNLLKSVENYTFKTNRSIEHLHPQNEENNLKWNNEDIDSFGNLAMISSGFNSTQSNDNVAVKFGRIKEQMERNSLESIKLLLMYQKANKVETGWNEVIATELGNEMIDILINSFSTDNSDYKEIREKLNKNKTELI